MTNALVYQVYVALLATVCLAATVGKLAELRQAWYALLAVSPMRRTAITLAANWAINTAFVIITTIHDPWLWFMLIDAISARIVLHQPAGRPQAIIGALYMVQITVHAIYFASTGVLAEPHYWQVLIALAFAQLIILGGWLGAYHLGGPSRRLWDRGSAALAWGQSEKSLGR